ncbi:eukaryotic translation initiation factor 4E-binding protein 1 isoform X4 [Ovis aries]|uniref:eukaryotic translation initiation factor 4E-binding protein 1 isoform X4 n=1 Tax=Ovis aries TaxID=9940 RepID=UPI00295290CB|nr:eukaryotic translation initiation factor 4E-binding protein 1 isoform X4 [Ovis aries]
MSGGSSCSQTPSRAIPTTRRVVLADGVQLPPGDYSTTPGGTLFSTTPGGTRIIYDRKFLMECRNSPVTKTPPRDLPTIPGVTSPTGDEPPTEASQNHLRSSPEDKPAGGNYTSAGSEEKAVAPHSSTLAWRIPWMEEPGRLQSMGSLGVGHD